MEPSSIQSQVGPDRFVALALLGLALTPGLLRAQVTINAGTTLVPNPAAATAPALTDPTGILISGGGQLRVTGAGTYMFGGSSAQPIILNGGDAAGAFRTQGVSTTVNNPFRIAGSSVLFVQGSANTMALNGELSGGATLTKLGAGTLDLRRANTDFGGAVVIENGVIALSHLGALANASSVTIREDDLQLNVRGVNEWRIGRGEIILDGGRLRQFDGGEGDIAILNQTIRLTSNGGNLGAPGDSRMYVEGPLVGPGDLRKSGGGELRFRGVEKTYTGETRITNGRLRIDDDGIPTRSSGFVLDGGNLRFGQRRERTYSLGAGGRAPIRIDAGGGSIEYTDEFGAILTNPIEVNGNGNFRARLAGSIFTFTGPLSGNGLLEINRGSTNNPMQRGTVYLVGDASAFSGDVDIVQSSLRLGSRSVLGANAFTVYPEGIYAPEIASPTQYARVAATSGFFGGGSRLAPIFTGGLPSGTTRFDLVTGNVVDGGVTLVNEANALVKFRTEVVPGAFRLLADVDYRGRKLGLNRIQSAVGDFLADTRPSPGVSAIQGYALNLETAAEVADFYDAVAAEEIGGLMDTAIYHSQDRLRRLVRNSPQVQSQLGLRDALGIAPLAAGGGDGGKGVLGAKAAASGKSPFIDASESGWTLFTDVSVQRGTRAREFELGGFQDSGSSFVLGADKRIGEEFALGFFGLYEHARTDFDRGRGWANSDSVGYGATAAWLLDRATVAGGIVHQRHSFDMERYTPLGTARSRPEGDQLGLFLEGSAQLADGPLSVVPSVFLQYNRLWIDGFRESGAPLAQQFGDLSGDSLLAGVGLRGGYTIRGNVVALRPEAFIEYRHELLDADRSISSTFPGAPGALAFETPGRARGYFATGLGLHAAFSDLSSAFVQYEAQLIEGQTRNYGIYGGFRWQFDGNPLLANPDLVFLDEERSFRETIRRTWLGEALDAINLRGLVQLQYDHAETESEGGTDPDPQDPDATDFWFVRRARLTADRDLPWGFNLSGGFQFSESDDGGSGVELFSTAVEWDLFEPFGLKAGYGRVPLGWEDATSSMSLKTIERSVAQRTFSRLGGDDIGRFKWHASAFGRFREIFTSFTGPIERYDFHYEFAVANPREGYDVPWSDDPDGRLSRWPRPNLYLRLHNELRTVWGTFDFGSDFADLPTFRARSANEITGAEAFSPFLNYNYGWFNLMAMWTQAEYRRDEENGGELRRPSGLTLTPSIFLTPKVELVGMYSFFDADGDKAVRMNQAGRNVPTFYPEDRRFDDIRQYYFGVNHYINGDDFKVMYGVENLKASGTREDRPVGEEDAWAFRMRVQMRY